MLKKHQKMPKNDIMLKDAFKMKENIFEVQIKCFEILKKTIH